MIWQAIYLPLLLCLGKPFAVKILFKSTPCPGTRHIEGNNSFLRLYALIPHCLVLVNKTCPTSLERYRNIE